jgi:hypothetical protein
LALTAGGSLPSFANNTERESLRKSYSDLLEFGRISSGAVS